MPDLLSSLDVVNQSFGKSFNGYNRVEVDEFLDRVAETLQSYNQKNKSLERELATKEENLAEFQKMKDVLHEALLMAQKSADERVKSANAEAEKIISDAREEAARIVSEAREKSDTMCRDAASEADRLRAGVAQIRNIRDMYATEFRGALAKFDNLLSQTVSSSQLTGAVDSVLEGMKKERADAAENENDARQKTEEKPKPETTAKDLRAAFELLGVDPTSMTARSESGGSEF